MVRRSVIGDNDFNLAEYGLRVKGRQTALEPGCAIIVEDYNACQWWRLNGGRWGEEEGLSHGLRHHAKRKFIGGTLRKSET